VGRFANGLALAAAGGINVPLAPGLVLPATQLFGRDTLQIIDTRDYAVFGQATINITDRLALIAGGRVTDTKVGVDYARTGSPGANAFNFILGGQFAPLAFTGVAKDTNVSWRLGAQYELGRDSNVYASIARGYKGPGWGTSLDLTIPAGTTAQAYTKVNPEIPTAYEIGYKGSLLDRRLLLTVALFRTDFKDFQAQVVETVPGSPIGAFVVRNAGKLRSEGVEIEATARPSDNLSIDLGFAYNDAKFVSFTGASCPRLGGLVATVGAPCGPLVAGGPNTNRFDASGIAATNAPKYSGNVGFRYDAPVAWSIRPYVQGNLYWRSDTTFGLYPRNIPNPTVQDAYEVVNGAIGMTAFDERLQVALFGRNLFDTNYVTSIFDLPFDAAGGFGQFVTRDAQRTIGVQANLRY
jgi:iron complex outermembrane receptor protein